jgi:acetyl esterase/lipase
MLDPQNPIFKHENPEQIPKHQFNPENIVIMGDSAGGALSISLLLYLKDYLKAGKETVQVPFPAGACVFSPWVDLTCSSDSWETNRDTDYLPCPQERSIFYNIFDELPGNPVQWYAFGRLDEKAIKELEDKDHGYASDEELADLSSIEDFAMKLVKHPLVSPLYGNLAGLPPIMMVIRFRYDCPD